MKKDGYYFINEQHERNFKRLLLKFPQGKVDAEYECSCYILALPMIFEKVEDIFATFKEPVDWIWRWEWKYTLMEERKQRGKVTGKESEFELGYDLTGSMIQLGKLSLNLWNGYKHFNLMECLSTLDGEHYQVVMCAIDIRAGRCGEFSRDKFAY